MTDITKFIDQLVTEKTFSMDGVKAIEALRGLAETLKSDLKTAQDRLAQSQMDVSSYETKNKKLEDENKNYRLAETAVQAREAAIFALEKDKAVSEAISSTWRNAFDTIFKNTIVRESINRSVPIATQYSGGNSMVNSYQTTETVTREEV